MNNEPSSVEKLWQDQPSEPSRISPEDLRRRATKFERRIFWRNMREYIAGAIVVAGFGYYEWRFTGLLARIGSGLTIAGTLYVMYQLHRRASVQPTPADLGRSTYVEFHRRELVRQREALRAIWSWYLLPFLPGIGVFLAGILQSAMQTARLAGHPLSASHIAEFVVSSAIFLAVVFVGIWLLNRWTANRLQRRIEELDAFTHDPKEQGTE